MSSDQISTRETDSPHPADTQPSREQQAFWREFVQLKTDACYVQGYRSAISLTETRIATVRAIASSASIGAWAIWKQYAFLWAALIATAQVADALRDVFPYRKHRQALSRWCVALNTLFVLAQRDWDEIATGKLTAAQIRRKTHILRLKQVRLEAKYAPDGLRLRPKLAEAAKIEAATYLSTRYLRKGDEV